MTLGAASWLHLLWLVPLLLLLLRAAGARRTRDLERLFAAGVLARHVPEGMERRRAFRMALWLCGFGLAALSAAQPRWGFTWEEIEVRGLEVVIALDLSRSMDAEDLSPSRLERARREVRDLLAEMPNDRVGLVIFAAGAYPRVPLTLDHEVLYEILEDTHTGVLQAQGSSVANALRESQRLFGDELSSDRAIILLSDGETWDEDLAAAAGELAEAKIEVYAIGVGTPEGAPIPESGGGFKQSGGEVVLSRLDERALSEIAAATGGAYVRSSASDDDTAGILRQLRASLTRTQSAVTREKRWDERFQWPLAAGLGLILLAAAMGDGRKLATAILLFALVMPARAAEEEVQALSQQALDHPDDPRVQWALAEALYKAGRYDDAARAFNELGARAPDSHTRTQALYNAGVARYRAGRLDEAITSWDEALKLDPEHAAAQKNREAVAQEIAARTQPPQPQQGEPQPGEPQPGEPQPGEPQPGQPTDQQETPQSGESQADPQATPRTDGQRAEQPPGEPGPPEPSPGEQGADPTSEGTSEDTGGAGAPAPGSMSADEARRLLDGVEEGHPRVVIRGKPEARDW